MKHGRLFLIIGIILLIAIIVFVVIKNKKTSTPATNTTNPSSQNQVTYPTFNQGDPIYSKNDRYTFQEINGAAVIYGGRIHPANTLLGYYVSSNPASLSDYTFAEQQNLKKGVSNLAQTSVLMSTRSNLDPSGDRMFTILGTDLYTK